MIRRHTIAAAIAVAGLVPAREAAAQPLGTFTWQLQPYCNVVTVTVTGTAGVFTLEGYDDQCGGPNRAPATGVATPNPDGTIGIGLNVIAAPGGHGLQVEARISASGLSGPWTDSDGHAGTFAFGTRTGGSPRPAPLVSGPIVPPAIGLQPDGGFVATGTPGTGAIPRSGAGTRMMWHPAKAALRAGTVTHDEWDDAAIGSASVAFGLDTVATGPYSVAAGRYSSASAAQAIAAGFRASASGNSAAAFGSETRAEGLGTLAVGSRAVASGSQAMALGSGVEATGNFSAALGLDTRASGIGSFAAGIATIASGMSSVALGGGTNGYGSLASGHYAVAIGQRLDAAGAGSIAMGSNASTTQAAYASFVYGDASTTTTLQSFAPNEFKVRAAGGTTFFSNGAMTAGVKLASNASAWSSLSDVNSKENFRDLDGEDVLARIARMPVREWNYKAQPAEVRHVGPTAQDFRAAFGLGEDPLRISTIDADGVALAAARALVARTTRLGDADARILQENADLRARVQALEAALAGLHETITFALARGIKE